MEDCEHNKIESSESKMAGQSTTSKSGRAVSNSSAQSIPTYNWKQVTGPFKSACGELGLGELMHDDMFGLFEAMSAIEMMDPKMDAGMRCNTLNKSSMYPGGRHQPLTFWTAQECGHLPMGANDTSSKDLIGILDETLACLVTWLEGHSLAQTVFTNLYLHSPWQVEHPLLKAYSIAILKLVDLVKDIVAKGSVYEEEDFQPLVYGFKLASEVSEMRAGGMLREVEDDLQRTLRATKPQKQPAHNDQKHLDDDKLESVATKAKQHEEAGALFSRLRFIRLFYLGLGCLFRLEIQEGQKYLSAAKEQFPNIQTTVNLGTKPQKGKNLVGFEPFANQRLLPPTFPRYTEIKERSSAFAYLQSLVERLIYVATNVVNRSQSFHSALEYFVELSAFTPCVLSRSTAQILYQPLHVFHTSGNTALSSNMRMTPNISSGSALPVPFVSFQEQLKDSCKAFLAPPVLTMCKSAPYNARAIRDYVDGFFSQCCRPMCMLIQTFGHNRARQRDKIPNLLEELALVQEEADKLDTMLNAVLSSGNCPSGVGSGNSNAGNGSNSKDGFNPNSNMLYLSTWLLYHVLRVMIRYVLSGFELELFSVHEYPYMYWYLYELLYPWLTTCLHRADSCLLEYEGICEAQQKAEKSDKHGKQNKKKSKTNKKNKSVRPHAKEITVYQGYAAMCAGYFKLLVGLKKDKKILIPIESFDNESVRYEHRFAPFNNLLTPPSMPYNQFMEVYSHTERSDSNNLYLMAARDFGRARQFFETAGAIPSPSPSYALAGGPCSLPISPQLQMSCNLTQQLKGTMEGGIMSCSGNNEDIVCSKDLATVNKINLVASSVLAKDSSRKVDFDFGTHITFPVLKFV